MAVCEAFSSLPLSFLSLPSLSPPLPLEVGPLNAAGVWGGAPVEIEFGAFYLYYMTFGGSNFTTFRESYCDFSMLLMHTVFNIFVGTVWI